MSITTVKMLMGVINNHILNYCEGDALTEAAECSRQVEDELTKAEARIAELESREVTDDQLAISRGDAQLLLDLCSECSGWMHEDQIEMMGRLVAALQKGEKG